jgi:hypothetical protein
VAIGQPGEKVLSISPLGLPFAARLAFCLLFGKQQEM